MEHISVKVLIVGGGPSGSTCGITLQKAGVDCCIVDKAKFPRVKLCAGLFTHKSQKCLLDVLGPADYAEAMRQVLASEEEEFGLWMRDKNLISCNQPATAKLLGVPQDGTGWDGHIRLVNRPVLDNYLLRYYQRLGGKILEGDGLKEIDFAQEKSFQPDAHHAGSTDDAHPYCAILLVFQIFSVSCSILYQTFG